jgi:hypothetical protein
LGFYFITGKMEELHEIAHASKTPVFKVINPKAEETKHNTKRNKIEKGVG